MKFYNLWARSSLSLRPDPWSCNEIGFHSYKLLGTIHAYVLGSLLNTYKICVMFNILLTATGIWSRESQLKVSHQTVWIRQGLCLGSLVYKAFGLSFKPRRFTTMYSKEISQ